MANGACRRQGPDEPTTGVRRRLTRRLFLFRILPGPALVLATRRCPGQLGDLLESGQRLLEQHVDPAALEALLSGDANQLDRWVREAGKLLQGGSVPELASLREMADEALPLLEGNARTRPYASWLRARLDYFDVAETFRAASKRPRTAPGQPAPPVPNPTPEQERRAWQRQVQSQSPSQPRGAATWVPRLKPVFRSAGAPPELAWLAEIESSFDPNARSPAGAVGLYQLMPRTAQDLGLKLEPQDERLVPEKSGRAAAVYLGRLQRQFKEWRLALAAYNAGPGRVSDLLTRRRARSFDAIAPDLPAETQLYVPKFEAVLKRREGVALNALKLPAAK